MNFLDQLDNSVLMAAKAIQPKHGPAFGDYYERLINAGRLLTDADRAVVGYVNSNWGKFGVDKCVELCCGLGQLTTALALLGIRCTGVDGDYSRHAASLALRDVLFTVATFNLGKWQTMCQEISAYSKLWIMTNAVSGDNKPEDTELLKAHLDNGGHLIWQPSLFGVDGAPLLEAEADEIAPGVWHQWK